MKAQDYWRKRVLYAKKKQIKASAQYEDAMRSRLQDLENEFEKEAFKYLQLYAKVNNTNIQNAAKYLASIDTSKFDMTLAEFEAKAKAGGYERELNSAYYKSRIARLQQLHKQYSELAAKYAVNESDRMGLALAKQYKDTYELANYNKYLVAGNLDVNFIHFNEQQLKDIVYQPWQGSNFSKRIWGNYTKVLPDMLTDSILRATLMGYSYERTTQMMRDKLTQFSNSNLHRLVFTEMGHAQEQATAEFYKDSDIDQYEYLAALESRTCDQCAHLDGRIFSTKKMVVGENYPLIHPYCRCSTCPYDPNLPDIQSRWYRDPITGKSKWVKNKMNYKQWAETTHINPLSKKKFLEAKPVSGRLNIPKLSLLEEKAIKDYVSSDSYKLNYALRNGQPLTEEQERLRDNLDKALKKMPYYTDDKPLQRDYFFMNENNMVDFLAQMDSGWFADPAYISSSKIHYGEGTEQVHVIIKKNKSGRDITQYNEQEQEVLFPRDIKFKVADTFVNEEGIKTIVWEEYDD